MVKALFFGVIFDLMLFGILTAQVYVYYISFPKDRILLKIAVIWVYLAGVAQTGLALLDLTVSFEYLIDGLPKFQTDHFSVSITALTGAVAIVIQVLYAHRIYLISKKRWLAIMIICMSFCQFASSILGAICYIGVEGIIYGVVVAPESDNPLNLAVNPLACRAGFTLIWGPVNVACDLTITICMVTFLLRRRKGTMRRQTHSHITRIVQIVIETGMATTVLMIIYAVLFSFWDFYIDFQSFFPLPGLMMSKVYSNSMLVLLNNRATIVNGRNAVESFEFVDVSPPDFGGDIEMRNGSRNSIVSMH